jgi:hypothetical protein
MSVMVKLRATYMLGLLCKAVGNALLEALQILVDVSLLL